MYAIRRFCDILFNNIFNRIPLAEFMGENISEKFEQAMSRLYFPWSEIRIKFSLCNWRDPTSIWGSLSKLIFKRNRVTLRKS